MPKISFFGGRGRGGEGCKGQPFRWRIARTRRRRQVKIFTDALKYEYGYIKCHPTTLNRKWTCPIDMDEKVHAA